MPIPVNFNQDAQNLAHQAKSRGRVDFKKIGLQAEERRRKQARIEKIQREKWSHVFCRMHPPSSQENISNGLTMLCRSKCSLTPDEVKALKLEHAKKIKQLQAERDQREYAIQKEYEHYKDSANQEISALAELMNENDAYVKELEEKNAQLLAKNEGLPGENQDALLEQLEQYKKQVADQENIIFRMTDEHRIESDSAVLQYQEEIRNLRRYIESDQMDVARQGIEEGQKLLTDQVLQLQRDNAALMKDLVGRDGPKKPVMPRWESLDDELTGECFSKDKPMLITSSGQTFPEAFIKRYMQEFEPQIFDGVDYWRCPLTHILFSKDELVENFAFERLVADANDNVTWVDRPIS